MPATGGSRSASISAERRAAAVAPVLVALAAGMMAAGATARTPVPTRYFIETLYPPTTAELEAARRHAGETFERAEAAGRPLTVRVARSEATILISLESVAVCDRVKACPLLVFRDITRPPVLITGAFQNVVLDYREDGTYLILRVWNDLSECRISGVVKAHCYPIKPEAAPLR